VATGRRDLERTARALLTADVGEIGHRRPTVRARPWQRIDILRPVRASEVRDDVCEVGDGHWVDAGELRLGCGLDRADEPVHAGSAGGLCGNEHAGDGSQAPVERELADRRVLEERVGRDLAGCGEHRERDRKVEAGALLPKPGRREIDRDPAKRPLELGARDATPYALFGLLASLVGKPDDREGRHAGLKVCFHLHGPGFEADKRVRDRSCKHGSKVRRNGSRGVRAP